MKNVPFNRRSFATGLACAAAVAYGINAVAQPANRQIAAVNPAVNAAAKVPAELGAFGGGTQWQMQGSGALRFFGFKAYDANLWTTAPTQNTVNPHTAKSLYALEIVYNTGIKSAEIVNVSLVEMARLRKLTDNQLKAWTAEMQRTFPSVVSGDRLTGLHIPNGGTRFFFNSRLISEIADPAYGDAFFAIWLDEGTKRPDLRKQLLGQPPTPAAATGTS